LTRRWRCYENVLLNKTQKIILSFFLFIFNVKKLVSQLIHKPYTIKRIFFFLFEVSSILSTILIILFIPICPLMWVSYKQNIIGSLFMLLFLFLFLPNIYQLLKNIKKYRIMRSNDSDNHQFTDKVLKKC